MNKQIKQLWEQSKTPVVHLGFVGDSGKYSVEKFAELIVRECANVALREDHDPSDCILNHFGIMTTKPFDLEAAKRGEPIVCRDGTPATFVADVPKWDSILVVLGDEDHCVDYAYSGLSKHSHKKDLFMAQKKRTVWVNFYENSVALFYDSQYKADQHADYRTVDRIGNRAYPVEIEE